MPPISRNLAILITVLGIIGLAAGIMDVVFSPSFWSWVMVGVGVIITVRGIIGIARAGKTAA